MENKNQDDELARLHLATLEAANRVQAEKWAIFDKEIEGVKEERAKLIQDVRADRLAAEEAFGRVALTTVVEVEHICGPPPGLLCSCLFTMGQPCGRSPQCQYGLGAKNLSALLKAHHRKGKPWSSAFE